MRSMRMITRNGLGEAESVATTAHRLVTKWHVGSERCSFVEMVLVTPIEMMHHTEAARLKYGW